MYNKYIKLETSFTNLLKTVIGSFSLSNYYLFQFNYNYNNKNENTK